MDQGTDTGAARAAQESATEAGAQETHRGSNPCPPTGTGEADSSTAGQNGAPPRGEHGYRIYHTVVVVLIAGAGVVRVETKRGMRAGGESTRANA